MFNAKCRQADTVRGILVAGNESLTQQPESMLREWLAVTGKRVILAHCVQSWLRESPGLFSGEPLQMRWLLAFERCGFARPIDEVGNTIVPEFSSGLRMILSKEQEQNPRGGRAAAGDFSVKI